MCDQFVTFLTVTSCHKLEMWPNLYRCFFFGFFNETGLVTFWSQMSQIVTLSIVTGTANPTWGDIFECFFKARSSKLERLFSLKYGKRDVRALSFELSKLSPQMELAVQSCFCCCFDWNGSEWTKYGKTYQKVSSVSVFCLESGSERLTINLCWKQNKVQGRVPGLIKQSNTNTPY